MCWLMELGPEHALSACRDIEKPVLASPVACLKTNIPYFILCVLLGEKQFFICIFFSQKAITSTKCILGQRHLNLTFLLWSKTLGNPAKKRVTGSLR